VRTLLGNRQQSPLKNICPGKVYRKDDDDQTHSHQFTQIEGLVVDDKTTLADLKGTLLVLARTLFGEDREIRLRPSFFPFTEPSVEVDVSCHRCNGKGCSLCKQTGWIEILGAGMVNNAVLTQAGYDPQKFQGFAFGMGVERIAMLKYGIDDIRMFFTNDLRFNRQFL
jgi:phenylalanyl-tRNA synthetase alpha chain